MTKQVHTGGRVLRISRLQRILVGLNFSLLTVIATAQSLPRNLSPEILSQIQAMSPTQQQALARQYGIAIPQGSGEKLSTPGLAMPGQALTSANDHQILANIFPMEEAVSDPVEEQTPTRFGQNLFNSEVSTFAPTDNAPVPESYRLGVGDQLIVQIFGKENEQINLQVGRSGDVAFPRLGSITLAGLSFDDARELIKTRVSQQLIGVDAVVSMGSLRAINVFMAGEVSVPGMYSVSALTTVTQALFQAGGVTEIGSLRAIQVRRGGG